MGLFSMTMRRVKKVIAWILALGILGLLFLGIIYAMEAGV